MVHIIKPRDFLNAVCLHVRILVWLCEQYHRPPVRGAPQAGQEPDVYKAGGMGGCPEVGRSGNEAGGEVCSWGGVNKCLITSHPLPSPSQPPILILSSPSPHSQTVVHLVALSSTHPPFTHIFLHLWLNYYCSKTSTLKWRFYCSSLPFNTDTLLFIKSILLHIIN